LVNPWIEDFAAYDVWAKPLGLLSLAGVLRRHGLPVTYIDCVNRFHPRARPQDPLSRNGRGPYLKQRLPKPSNLSDVDRIYSRYGIPRRLLREDLARIPRPDLILVTSHMTYWYTGVQATIKELKQAFPAAPLVLGGIYATLCQEHASAETGADAVITGAAAHRILSIVEEFSGWRGICTFDTQDLDAYPYPAFDLQDALGYIPILTALGCPYSCAYCASRKLQPERRVRSPRRVVSEIRHWQNTYGIKDFVFYDDALLVGFEKHARPLFEQIIESGVKIRFHTPNAVHIREITPRAARLMAAAGFATLRLGLETLNGRERSMDRKVQREEFFRAARYLREAGFDASRLGAYLLVGLPDEDVRRVSEDIRMVRQNGVQPILAYYSPIPHTAMWQEACRTSRYDLAADPLFTNNAVFPCRKSFDWRKIIRLRQLARDEVPLRAAH
jgi:radical SAM superfamily enzyme YgiQ (UPF0313 family)